MVAVIAVLASGCDERKSADSVTWQEGKLRVVATTTMLADLCRVVGGDAVQVVGLMGPEQDPHSYVSRVGDAKLLADAQVIVANGLRLEGKLVERLSEKKQSSKQILIVGDQLPSDLLLAPQEEFEGTKDPHVWGDVALWKQATDLVAAAFSQAMPEQKSVFIERAKQYNGELSTLDAWIRTEVAQVPEAKRVLVTGHDAFFYFGKAYGFQVRGVRGVSSAVESDLRQNQELATFIRERGIRTIFAESTVNGKEVNAVAERSGAVVSAENLYSDALGKDGDVATYLGMMRHNVKAIVEGLK